MLSYSQESNLKNTVVENEVKLKFIFNIFQDLKRVSDRWPGGERRRIVQGQFCKERDFRTSMSVPQQSEWERLRMGRYCCGNRGRWNHPLH